MRHVAVMMQGRTLAAAAVALYCLGAPGSARSQGAPCSGDYTNGVAQLDISADEPTLVVSLTRAPITRLRLSLDQIKPRRGKHVELEWEPNLPDTLVKSVTLAEGEWNVSFWAEPILRVESYSGQSFYVEMNLNCFKQAPDARLEARAHVFNALPAKDKGGDNTITYPSLIVNFRTEGLPDMVSASNLGAAGPLYDLREVQGRGLADPIPPGVQEAFQLLAEIALERAKSRGMQVLRDQLVDRLCERLRWDVVLERVPAHLKPKMPPTGKLLTRTCSVINSLRLQDLASSGRTVLRALREDFARSVVPFFAQVVEERMGWTPELARIYDKLVPIAAEVAAGNRPTKEQARLLLIELSRQDWLRDALLAQLAAALRDRLRTDRAESDRKSRAARLAVLARELRHLNADLTRAQTQHLPEIAKDRIRKAISDKLAAIKETRDAKRAAEKELEELKATHERLSARIRLAFRVYDQLRQADLIAPAMRLLDDDSLRELVRDSYTVHAGLRPQIAVSLSAHLGEDLLRTLVTNADCGEPVAKLGKAKLIACVRKKKEFADAAIGTLLAASPADIRHTVDDVLRVRSWDDPGSLSFASLSQNAREVVFRAMVARVVEVNLDAFLDAADASLLRSVTEYLRGAANTLLTPEEKQRLTKLLDDHLQKPSWNPAELEEVRRQWARFLNGVKSTRRQEILRNALAGDMLDHLVVAFFGDGAPKITLAGAIADPRQIVAQLTEWGLEQIRNELEERMEELHPAVGCGLQLAFAVLSKCVGDGSCTTNQISEIFREPQAHFQAAIEGLHAMCWEAGKFIDVSEAWPDLDVFASKVVTVFFPEPGATGTEMATAAADVFFDVAMRLACGGPAVRCHGNDKNAQKLQALHAIVHAMLQHDVGTVLVETSHLAEQYIGESPGMDHLRQATELIGAIAAYASTFDTKVEDAEALAAAREARKRAIESLIDAATDRRGRHGDVVWSIGSNVGFSVWRQQYLRDTEDDGLAGAENQWLQLQLPMGIALQKVWDTQKRDKGLLCNSNIGCGLHAQLSLVDLGQFLANSEGEFNEVTPRDFITVGAQVGFILGSPSMPFVLGVDARWAPSLFPRTCSGGDGSSCGDEAGKTRSGAFQWGFFLSYYVPFFDLN